MKSVRLRLNGIIAAVPTPFSTEGDVDPDALRRIVRHLLEGGVHGLWVLGSGGEFACLNTAQQATVIRTITAEVAGRVPVIAGTGGAGTALACESARQAERCGADAISMIAPYFYTCSEGELPAHFRAVASASSLPAVLYNNPWNTKTQLSANLVAALSADPRIIAIKDSSTDWKHFSALMEAVPRDGSFGLFQGDECAIGKAVLAGADGAVVALPVVAPRLCVSLYEAARRKDEAKTSELQEKVADLFRIYLPGEGRSPDSAFLANQKAALELLGLCSRHVAAPFQEATPGEVKAIAEILGAHGLLPAGA